MKNAIQIFCALILSAATPSFAAAPLTPFEQRREQAAESAIYGCSLAIEDHVVAGYMKRRADVGNPVANEADVRAAEWWRTKMLPMFRSKCICLFEAPLSEIRSARTDEELHTAVERMSGFAESQPIIQKLESRAPACFGPPSAADA